MDTTPSNVRTFVFQTKRKYENNHDLQVLMVFQLKMHHILKIILKTDNKLDKEW